MCLVILCFLILNICIFWLNNFWVCFMCDVIIGCVLVVFVLINIDIVVFFKFLILFELLLCLIVLNKFFVVGVW